MKFRVLLEGDRVVEVEESALRGDPIGPPRKWQPFDVCCLELVVMGEILGSDGEMFPAYAKWVSGVIEGPVDEPEPDHSV